jgi:hypothetical protein
MTLNAISDLPLPPESATTAAPPPVFLTTRQLAAALGVCRRTLAAWNQRRIISCADAPGNSTATGTTATH